MNDNNINVFISSKCRDIYSKPSNFTCYLPSDKIICGDHQGINVNVVSFDILNSMYNINDFNNSFEIITTNLDGSDMVISVCDMINGSYSVADLMTYVTNFQSVFDMSYSSVRNRFIFNKKATSKKVFIKIINCGSFLGFDNDSTIEITAEIESANVVNMVYYNKIILRTDNIDFEVASLDNMASVTHSKGEFDVSNILLWVSKNDIAPFQVISYNNYDGGNSYCYNIYNKQVNSINFVLCNEFNEEILDAPDWTMCIQFTIYDKKDDAIVRELGISNGYLREIFVLLNFFYSYLFGI